MKSLKENLINEAARMKGVIANGTMKKSCGVFFSSFNMGPKYAGSSEYGDWTLFDVEDVNEIDFESLPVDEEKIPEIIKTLDGGTGEMYTDDEFVFVRVW